MLKWRCEGGCGRAGCGWGRGAPSAAGRGPPPPVPVLFDPMRYTSTCDVAFASASIIIIRARCERRYSTAGTTRPVDIPPPRRVDFNRPARTTSSKNTADSTLMALVLA